MVAHREVPREAFHAATAWDPIPSLQLATASAVADVPEEPVVSPLFQGIAAVSEEIPPGESTDELLSARICAAKMRFSGRSVYRSKRQERYPSAGVLQPKRKPFNVHIDWAARRIRLKTSIAKVRHKAKTLRQALCPNDAGGGQAVTSIVKTFRVENALRAGT